MLAWKDFAKTELERQVSDFATNLAMDSSQGSAFLSTSGYQTSLKNSSSSFQFLGVDDLVGYLYSGVLIYASKFIFIWDRCNENINMRRFFVEEIAQRSALLQVLFSRDLA